MGKQSWLKVASFGLTTIFEYLVINFGITGKATSFYLFMDVHKSTVLFLRKARSGLATLALVTRFTAVVFSKLGPFYLGYGTGSSE